MFFIDREVLKEQLSYYGLVSLSCFLIGTIAALVTAKLKIDTLGQRLFEQKKFVGAEVVQSWYKTPWGIEILVGFVSVFTVSIYVTEFSLKQMLHEDGFAGAVRIFYGLTHPSTEIIPSAIIAMMETVFMAFLATALAIPIAFVLSFMSAKNVMGSSSTGLGIYFFLRMILNLVRSMEPVVWAIIFSVWVGIGPFAGMFALMIHSVASLTKQYSEMVESVDKGPIEGILSTGAGTLQVLWFAIVPQVILPYVSFTIYRWDINVRMATIVGLVGGGGIGTMLFQYQQQAQWNEVGALVLLIAFVVWSMDAASAYIREAVK
jgi:phosphonate transport system permease protein